MNATSNDTSRRQHVADQARARLLGHHSSTAAEARYEHQRITPPGDHLRDHQFVKDLRTQLTLVQRTLLTLLIATFSLSQVRAIVFQVMQAFGQGAARRLFGLWDAWCVQVPTASDPGGTTYELEVSLGRLLGKRLVTYEGHDRVHPATIDGRSVRCLRHAVDLASTDPHFERRMLDLVERARDVWRETGQGDLAFDSLSRALSSSLSSEGEEPFVPASTVERCPACAVDERQRRHCLCGGTGTMLASGRPLLAPVYPNGPQGPWQEAVPAGLDSGSSTGGAQPRPVDPEPNPSAPSLRTPPGAGPARARLYAAIVNLLADVYPSGEGWAHVSGDLTRLESVTPLRELRDAWEAYARPPGVDPSVPMYRWWGGELDTCPRDKGCKRLGGTSCPCVVPEPPDPESDRVLSAARELLAARDTLAALVAMQRLRDAVQARDGAVTKGEGL